MPTCTKLFLALHVLVPFLSASPVQQACLDDPYAALAAFHPQHGAADAYALLLSSLQQGCAQAAQLLLLLQLVHQHTHTAAQQPPQDTDCPHPPAVIKDTSITSQQRSPAAASDDSDIAASGGGSAPTAAVLVWSPAVTNRLAAIVKTEAPADPAASQGTKATAGEDMGMRELPIAPVITQPHSL